MTFTSRSLIAVLGLCAGASVVAQSIPPPTGGPFVIQKQVIAAGGARASGGSYVLTGTIAQAAAGPVPSEATGAGYRLSSGFHAVSTPLPDALFSHGFEN